MNSTLNSIRQDYLSGHASLRTFYQYGIQDIDFSQIIADKSKEHIDRQLLQKVITDQYEGFTLSEQSQQHLQWLGQDNCFTLTTGHQLVLYGGPLFTTYKVLSIAKLAQQLNREHAEHRFVPIFWIHTEDHDYEEVNHYFKSFGQKIEYQGTFQTQVGSHVISSEIEKVVPDSSWAKHYQVGQTWTQAFRSLAHALFDEYGVLMLDADHPDLKAVFQPVLRAELLDSVAHEQISDQSQKLDEARYKQQISPRDINLFYLDEKGRDRIDRDGEDFLILNRDQKISRKDLLALVETHPGRFSPNVSLRPLYQEMILPNLAYFGGWGEISYWLQLKSIFDKFDVNFPLLMPRFSATIFTKSQLEAWQNFGFEMPDIQSSVFDLYRTYLPHIWDDSQLLTKNQELLAHLDALTRYIEADISPTLARSGLALRAHIQKKLNRIHKKAEKVMRNRFPKPFQEIEQLKLSIQPDGAVQERVLCLFSFPDIDPKSFIEQVWQEVEPLNPTHRYLVLDAL